LPPAGDKAFGADAANSTHFLGAELESQTSQSAIGACNSTSAARQTTPRIHRRRCKHCQCNIGRTGSWTLCRSCSTSGYPTRRSRWLRTSSRYYNRQQMSTGDGCATYRLRIVRADCRRASREHAAAQLTTAAGSVTRPGTGSASANKKTPTTLRRAAKRFPSLGQRHGTVTQATHVAADGTVRCEPRYFYF
jgi:hypothetical protein